ncbi:hypothetical protein LTR37_005795 [Vermiconidia calcicola]|uniref:Uncharacterized protein n=1 Tax=Vermiconidia calcicola TaxID=1690605 RepID=A0ACC3NJ48_9PEZI|nr:hypothetical protein LTR37_005795 [Vermiconidia calcicola]
MDSSMCSTTHVAFGDEHMSLDSTRTLANSFDSRSRGISIVVEDQASDWLYQLAVGVIAE